MRGGEPVRRSARVACALLAVCACARSRPTGAPRSPAGEVPAKTTPAPGSPARPTATLLTAKRVMVDSTRIKPPRAKAILMGERWGCARFMTEAGSRWQCWDAVTTSSGQRAPQAWAVPWLSEGSGTSSVMTAADQLCAFEGTRAFRCWARPHRGEAVGHELPARMGWANPAYAASSVPNADSLRDFPRGAFTGGTFGCLLGQLGDLWCVGDDDLGQLGDSGHRLVDQGLPTFFIRPNSWDVALGVWHGCVLPDRSSRAVCWGRGDFGQLGGIPATTCTYGKR